jgi:hypothetical protein
MCATPVRFNPAVRDVIRSTANAWPRRRCAIVVNAALRRSWTVLAARCAIERFATLIGVPRASAREHRKASRPLGSGCRDALG